MQAAAANGAFPYPGLFPPLGQFAPFPRPPLFPPILPPSPPSPGSIRKQELPPHLGGRPLLPLIPPPQCSTSPPSLRSPTSELRDSIFQSQNHLRAIAGQELDNEQDSKVRAVSSWSHLKFRHGDVKFQHKHISSFIIITSKVCPGHISSASFIMTWHIAGQPSGSIEVARYFSLPGLFAAF